MADPNLDEAPVGLGAAANEHSAASAIPDSEDFWGHSSAPSLPSVDNDTNDNDSAVGGMSGLSSTASLRSSIYEHEKENGRTYHAFKKGKYMLPNDEQEQERLDIQHAMFGVTLKGRLHLAPIGPNPQNVLDFATGTGIWAIEFAQQYPSARVLGTDLSPIQPLYVPPNCRFEIDDAEDEWVFHEKFDFVHARAVLSCFKDPAAVLAQAYQSLAPGGYLEMQDMLFPICYIGEPPVESSMYKWCEIITKGAANLGRPWTNVQHYGRWMKEVGFEDVVETNYYWPLNGWAKGPYYKHVSMYAQVDFLNGLEGMSLKIMGSMGYSPDDIRALVAEVTKDVKDPNIHAFFTMKVVYGRKPAGQPEE